MRAQTLFPAAAIAAAVTVVAVGEHGTGDYLGVLADDNPAPFIEALAQGDLGAAGRTVPGFGLTSLLPRVPAAALTGDLRTEYVVGSLVLLSAVVAFLALADRALRARDASPLARLLLPAAVILGAPVMASVHVGHPEEPLAGVLCIAAIVAASRDRALAAGLLLGAAIGTKQWGVLAAPIVLASVGGPQLSDKRRVLAALSVGAAAALLILPPVVGNPSRYQHTTATLSGTHRVYTTSAWWPVSTARTQTVGAVEPPLTVTTYRLPGGLTRGTALLPAYLIALLAGAAVWRRRISPMAALVAVLAARCAADPMNLDYYAGPLVLALAWWEATTETRSDRLPAATLAAAGLVYTAAHYGHAVGDEAEWAMWMLALMPAAWTVVHAARHHTAPGAPT